MRVRIFVVLSLLAITTASVAAAQPAPADVARAVKLFDEAKGELEAGHVEKACSMFVESYRLDPQVGTLLNTALCHERAGNTASAWAEFNSVASLATRAAQPKRAELARNHARALEPSLSRVRFDVRETAPDLVIKIDGTAVATDTARTTPIPVDPGEHVVRATATAKKPWETKLIVATGPSSAQLVVPVLEIAPASAPPAATAAAAPSGADTSSSTPAVRWAAFGTAGLAVVGLTVGAITGGLALSARNDADRDCEGAVCRTPKGVDANDRAQSLATVSTIGFVAGGVLAATAIVLFVIAPKTITTSRIKAAPSIVIAF